LYHAAVSRKVLDELEARTGRIFHTTQPDVFLAYALPAFRTHAQYIPNPITINGRSAASTGYAAIVAGSDARSSAIVREFIDEYGISYKLDESLSPFMPEGLNWIADTILVAMKMFPELYRNVSFNYSAFYATWAAHGPWRHFDRIAGTIRARNEIRRYHRFGILAYLLNWARIRLKQATGRRLAELHNRKTISSEQRPSDVWECARLFVRN
jgi:hypothetical protein